MAKDYYATIIVFDQDPNNPGKYKRVPARTCLNSGLHDLYNVPLDVVKNGGIENALDASCLVCAKNTKMINHQTSFVAIDQKTKIEQVIITVNFDDQFFRKAYYKNHMVYCGVIYCEADVDSIRDAINRKIPFKENDPYKNREFILEGNGRRDESQPTK